MSNDRSGDLSRRSFLHDAGALGSGAMLLGVQRESSAAERSADPRAIPRRQLGRTQQQVTTLALGTWPSGRSRDVDMPDMARLVNEALDLGINIIDTARAYGKAEEGIGNALGKRRDQVFLATKVWADDAAEAKESFEKSLRLLKTDRVELVYLHGVGSRDLDRVLADDGALAYLLDQKKAGKTRFVGISGHNKVQSFVPLLETGDIDVVLMTMNFVDRHTYAFEEVVLPVANRHNVGVACMKVFGGMRGGFGVADGPNPGPQMSPRFIKQAIRYSLGLPGVSTLVIGPHTVEQLRENVRLVTDYQPLSDDEYATLMQLGRQLAAGWGEHFGPVA